VEAGSIEFPFNTEEVSMNWGGSIFQGHAVVHDTILISLLPPHLLFSFNCSTRTWTAVTTTTTKRATNRMNPSYVGINSNNVFTENTASGTHNDTASSNNTSAGNDTTSRNILSIGSGTRSDTYAPIRGRGVYVEEDDAIYFLQKCALYAYRLNRHDRQQTLVELKPAISRIDSVCPFSPAGSAMLTHLGGRVMCSVWISVARDCPCDKYHVLISTFRVKLFSDGVPSGIEVLHSTCRQLDMLPCKPTILPTDAFCFLQ
jgi:hypothetical protein